jgi:excisionase family DNA binding protein
MSAQPAVLLTIPDVASALQCSQRHVYQLLSEGRIASVKVGSLRRVAPAALDRYVESLTAEADRAAARA